MNKLSALDYVIFVIYFLIVSIYGYSVYRKKKKTAVSGSHDFFLAEGSLTWWAIGASLIASNISAEQFIGASGQGFTVGVAVAAYEWIAAIALIIVAVWFIPVYLKNKIYTMPQFLETRYNRFVSLVMAIFWLILYVLVNLTSILYLGALAIGSVLGGDEQTIRILMIALALFALIIALGGMKVIGYTDVIQVLVLVIGGLATTYIALTMVSEKLGLGKDFLAGFNAMIKDSPDHFKMMLAKPDANSTAEYVQKYLALPGIAMYFAGQWVVNLNYWGCNQYITQRALGADMKTARTGILFAGLMKLAMPIIVILPGIAAYVLYKHGAIQHQMAPNGHVVGDNAYSAVLGYLPNGLKGLSVAALTAAIVASLAGKANSISTIWTMDIYQKYIKKDANEKNVVGMGKWVVALCLVFSIALTWHDTLGIGGEGGFTFIQKGTGFISPGIFAIFILGFFWKRTTSAGAFTGIVVALLSSVVFNIFAPTWFGKETFLYTAYLNAKGAYEIPFLICMGLSFLFSMISIIVVSMAGEKINAKAFVLDKEMFKVDTRTLVLIIVTLILLAGLYITFW